MVYTGPIPILQLPDLPASLILYFFFIKAFICTHNKSFYLLIHFCQFNLQNLSHYTKEGRRKCFFPIYYSFIHPDICVVLYWIWKIQWQKKKRESERERASEKVTTLYKLEQASLPKQYAIISCAKFYLD